MDMDNDKEFVEANRAYWDKMAALYDTKPWQQKMSSQIIAEIQQKSEFIGVDRVRAGQGEAGKSVRLLDYACGTGMVSKALSPFITDTIGVDLSANMVSRFDSLSSELINSSKSSSLKSAKAFEGNLLSSDPHIITSGIKQLPSTEILGGEFDIAAIGLGFHHFSSPLDTLKALRQFLKPGGVLLIIDFLPDKGGWLLRDHDQSHDNTNSHDDTESRPSNDDGKADVDESEASKTIKTHGFSGEDMEKLWQEAGGFGNVGYSIMPEEVALWIGQGDGGEGRRVARRVFLARASKVGM